MQKKALLLLSLVGLSGCSWNKKKDKDKTKKVDRDRMVAMAENVDMPLAGDDTREFLLDENLDDLTLPSNDGFTEYELDDTFQTASLDFDDEDFGWVEEPEEVTFKQVYFDWDSDKLDADQEAIVQKNIDLARKVIEEYELFGNESTKPQIVIEGNSCHAAGTRTYNLVLSEKRAKVLADKFKEAGIDEKYIKVVAHGSEVPAIVDGEIVTGDRQQQWPNRRDEVRVIYG